MEVHRKQKERRDPIQDKGLSRTCRADSFEFPFRLYAMCTILAFITGESQPNKQDPGIQV
jgi:hypothetical protein